MKEYKFTEKKMDINGRTVDAFFVKNHSRIKGLVFDYVDLNYDDGWSNIRRWSRIMCIMEKGSENWKTIPNNHPDYEWAKMGMGIFNVLHGLETDKVMKKIENEDRIKYLKQEIQDMSKELEKRKALLLKYQGSKRGKK